MKLGIMQPYFMPYIGYFQLMKAVDKYVVYDDVDYIKGGWVSRNQILVNGEKKMFTVTLKGASPNKRFNEIEIGDDFGKLMKTLRINYSKAPCFQETMALMERIVAFPDKNLSRFILNSFREIADFLDIRTELLPSSGLEKDNSLKGADKVLHICRLLGADTYYNAIGGRELYDKDEFRSKGVRLEFLSSEVSSYRQFKEEFVPGLSLIDVLMFNAPEEIDRMLNRYTLV